MAPESLVHKNIKMPRELWQQIEQELKARGGIDFTAFAREAFANEVRQRQILRAREESALYGTPNHDPPHPQRGPRRKAANS